MLLPSTSQVFLDLSACGFKSGFSTHSVTPTSSHPRLSFLEGPASTSTPTRSNTSGHLWILSQFQRACLHPPARCPDIHSSQPVPQAPWSFGQLPQLPNSRGRRRASLHGDLAEMPWSRPTHSELWAWQTTWVLWAFGNFWNCPCLWCLLSFVNVRGLSRKCTFYVTRRMQ